MARAPKQLSLVLPRPRRWGGARPGAGRPRKTDVAELPHGKRKAFKKLPAHVTVRMREDVPSLRLVAIVHEIERTFARGCARDGFRLVHYSLQANHAHLIVEAADRHALGRGMKAIGARLARAVNRIANRRGPVFVDRYHHRLLRTPTEVRNALRYVLLNARHHAAKKPSAPREAIHLDRASSARWFDGWRRFRATESHESTRSPEPPPIARPEWWLLKKGWKLCGLLDPAYVPG
jgi:REP element-mobilizing transposase RayT